MITVNVNELNTPVKRQLNGLKKKKEDPYMCCLTETHFRFNSTYRLKVGGMEKNIPCKWK